MRELLVLMAGTAIAEQQPIPSDWCGDCKATLADRCDDCAGAEAAADGYRALERQFLAVSNDDELVDLLIRMRS